MVSYSILIKADENRDWHIYSALATYQIELAKPLYCKDNDFDLDINILVLHWIQPTSIYIFRYSKKRDFKKNIAFNGFHNKSALIATTFNGLNRSILIIFQFYYFQAT